MKKTLIVLALAFAMVAMVVGSAYALYTTPVQMPAAPNSALHGGYSTSTNACVQCHIVHGAETFVDAPLWRWANAGAGCAYCHDGAGAATNTKVYVDATATAEHTITAAVLPDGTNTAPIAGGAAGLDCFDCHNGGVHGAGGGYYALTLDATPNAFCGRCHDLNLTNGVIGGTSHALVAADSTHAWVGSPNCISCHDDDVLTVDFPHQSPNYVFAGADSSAGALDAVCLACHKSGVMGVGSTY